ncbi:flagellar assembly protein FliH [Halalkalibacter alkalisediminis]|uniref:Flagellar assembly protein FliH n=1 Tax=Halalkalibacter alkalisediminis TaxID=935616 RepID=A0ABV6ND77_9BACI|nr:flagellar assembly protein FliH [Halalkalibacter alkalisediminis]
MSKIIKSLHSPHASTETKQITIRNLFEEGIFNKLEINSETKKDSEKMIILEERQKQIEIEIAEAQKKAKQVLAEAKEQASRVLEQAELERQQAHLKIEEARAEAMNQGYQEGLEHGQSEGFQSYSNLIQQARAIIAQSEQEYEKTLDSAEPVIVELATAVARRMIDVQLTENQEIWSSLLKQVMTEVREHENVRIYVHPDWFERTTHQKEELEQLLSHTENLFIYPDAGLMKNGCVIESKYGRIEATIDKQLEELKRQLLEKLKEGDHEGTSSY